ncbi:hypothetical protein UPYG_G00045140 [Umbra pygmaea]|uniref:Uncharacterized protein n=1 Tax=Umbra pygmaea TaxID=75934 RepID=A0ABD0YEV2_UMBPY
MSLRLMSPSRAWPAAVLDPMSLRLMSPSRAWPAAVLDPKSLRLMIPFPPDDASFHLQAASRSSFARTPNCIDAT